MIDTPTWPPLKERHPHTETKAEVLTQSHQLPPNPTLSLQHRQLQIIPSRDGPRSKRGTVSQSLSEPLMLNLVVLLLTFGESPPRNHSMARQCATVAILDKFFLEWFCSNSNTVLSILSASSRWALSDGKSWRKRNMRLSFSFYGTLSRCYTSTLNKRWY